MSPSVTYVSRNVTHMVPIKTIALENLNLLKSLVTSKNPFSPTNLHSNFLKISHILADFWVALVVLFRRLVVLSLQLSDNEDILKNAKAGSDKTPNESNGSVAKRENGHFDEHQPISDLSKHQNERAALLARLTSATRSSRVPLPNMAVARCSIGAAFVNGKIVICGKG